MTTIDAAAAGDSDEQDGDPLAAAAIERRTAASGVRLSWAGSAPFVPPSPDAVPSGRSRPFDPVARAAARRALWVRPLVARALAGDAVVAATVWGALAATGGASPVLSALAAVLAATVWCAALWSVRGYDGRRIGQGPDELGMVVRAAAGVLLVALVVLSAAQVVPPRRYVLLAVPLAAGATLVHRYVVRKLLHRRRLEGTSLLRTLVVGSPSAADDVIRDLATVRHDGHRVVGACVPALLTDVGVVDDVAILGTLSDIPQVVIDHEVDVVIVAGAGLSGASLRRLSWALDRTGADMVVAPGLVEVAGPRLHVRPTAGLSLLHVESPQQHQGRMLGKALLDRSLGLALFVGALPFVAAAAALVRLTSRGPAFFAQERIGRDGRSFTLHKLRSMVVDAEDRRTDDLLERSDRDGLMFKMRRDPRITPVGAWLRRFSIDELPQLWNVVRGDMSLVGPRPPLRSEFDAYHDAVQRRMRVKPGLTGLWQVSGRADLTWEESVRLDLRYVDNWSVALDLQILWKTFRAVFVGAGAY